jgi:hypothetical protein
MACTELPSGTAKDAPSLTSSTSPTLTISATCPRALKRLRAAGPIVKTRFPIIGTVWITTTYEMAGRVLKDSGTFTLRKDGQIVGFRWWMPPASCGSSPTTC